MTEHERNPLECLASLSIMTSNLGVPCLRYQSEPMSQSLPCPGGWRCIPSCQMESECAAVHGTLLMQNMHPENTRNAQPLRKTSSSQEQRGLPLLCVTFLSRMTPCWLQQQGRGSGGDPGLSAVGARSRGLGLPLCLLPCAQSTPTSSPACKPACSLQQHGAQVLGYF